jgi:hypothetical protein
MNVEELRAAMQGKKGPVWLGVPIISLGGVLLGSILGLTDAPSILMNPGIIGCIIGSFLLAGIAYLKPRRDLVSLLAPMYAIIIFNPYSEFGKDEIALQALYAITLTAVAYRLEKRFSEPPATFPD